MRSAARWRWLPAGPSPLTACRRKSPGDASLGLPSPAGREPRLIADRPNMDELQRRYLLFTLEENGWNRRRVATVLNRHRRTIQRHIARYLFQGAPDPEEDPDVEAAHDSLERPLD